MPRRVMLESSEVLTHTRAALKAGPSRGAPADVIRWLADLRLLRGAPFAYLVAHDELLPPESIRFFYLDRNWTDAAVDGALSVGAITSKDRAQLHRSYVDIRDAVDDAERNRWEIRIGKDPTIREKGPDGQRPATEVVTGFLLRSRAVSGWPGLHVRAFTDDAENASEVPIMRLERLAPAVLLAIFDGIPGFMTITEPRQGVQFGVDQLTNKPPETRWVPKRDPDTGEFIHSNPNDPDSRLEYIKVPFRNGSPGVIHFAQLRERFKEVVGPDPTSADIGLQMLQSPFQQEFDDSDPVFDVFNVTVALDELRLTHKL